MLRDVTHTLSLSVGGARYLLFSVRAAVLSWSGSVWSFNTFRVFKFFTIWICVRCELLGGGGGIRF